MFRPETTRELKPARRERGFTLVEMVVVLLAIAIISAVIVPQVIAHLRLYRLGATGRNVATALQRARFLATSNNTRAGIRIAEDQRINIEQYDPQGIAEPQNKGIIVLPAGITVSPDAPTEIAFDGRGIITPMPNETQVIRINGQRGYYMLVAISPTGQVTVSEAKREDEA
jgi:prepilin-type N-terminal cleavage/methylation domain-containing protein